VAFGTGHWILLSNNLRYLLQHVFIVTTDYQLSYPLFTIMIRPSHPAAAINPHGPRAGTGDAPREKVAAIA
jgi:hypothetical protein